MSSSYLSLANQHLKQLEHDRRIVTSRHVQGGVGADPQPAVILRMMAKQLSVLAGAHIPIALQKRVSPINILKLLLYWTRKALMGLCVKLEESFMCTWHI